MRTLARLAQVEHSAARDHFTAMTDERFDQLFEIQQARLAIDHRHHVDTEHVLHLGVLVQIVEHHFRHFAATQLDHHAHAVFVGLVAQRGDAFDFLVFHQLSDFFHQPRLVHLIRQLGDHDAFFTGLVVGLDMRARAQIDFAASGVIRIMDAARTVNDRSGREIRAGNMLHQSRDVDVGIVDQREAGINDFGEIVRRNVGGHTHRNT